MSEIIDAAAVLAVDSRGRTALHRVTTAEGGRALLALGFDVDAADCDGWTPLHSACGSGDTPVVDVLLDAGARSLGTNFQSTPIHFAARGGYTEVVARLLANGPISVNGEDHIKMTPLHCACKGGHTSTVVALLAAGASVDAKDRFGRTPYDVTSCGQDRISALVRPTALKTEEPVVVVADKDPETVRPVVVVADKAPEIAQLQVVSLRAVVKRAHAYMEAAAAQYAECTFVTTGDPELAQSLYAETLALLRGAVKPE